MVSDTVRYAVPVSNRRSQYDVHLYIGGREVVRRVRAFNPVDALKVAAGASRTNLLDGGAPIGDASYAVKIGRR